MKKIYFALFLLFILVLGFICFKLYEIKNYPINSFIKDISNYNDKNKRTKYLWDAYPQYDYAYFKNQNILEISNRKQLKVRDLLKNKKYIFINFWFKGCGACEAEMPEIDNFYKKYQNKIQFIIISNDHENVVKAYLKKNKFQVPFYIFDNDTFPIGVNAFPTSHLIINNQDAFIYANRGYYDNDEFYNFLEQKIIEGK